MNKKVLVTGASGFVGACITRRLLKENYEVHIVAREKSDLWRLQDVISNLQIHNTDLMNDEEVTRLADSTSIDIIYHLATYGGYHYQTNLDNTINTNLIGTWNLFREFSKKGIEMFINTSSSSEYGEKFEPMREDMKVEPNNMYGATKASATILCSTYAKVTKTPLVTLRLFSPYGYYDAQTRLIPTVISSCLLGKEIKLAQKDSKRDYIFIDDVVEAYLSVSKLSSLYGEVFNVGSGIQYTVEQIVNTINNLTSKDIKLEWGNNFNRQYEPGIWVSDNKKVENKLNWEPNIGIEDGLKATIKWFENNLKYYEQVITI